MKVLHVLRQLEPGGIEYWLQRLVQKWPQPGRPDFTIALEEEATGTLSSRFVEAGARLVSIGHPMAMTSYCWRLWRLLKDEGPFQAIHCHTHKAAFLPLLVAWVAGVPVRAAHAHADFRGRRLGVVRRLYETASSWLVEQLATVRLAVSQGAGKDLFATSRKAVDWLPCGIDPNRYRVRDERGSDQPFTLIHVGRLSPEKNHEFLLRLMFHLRQEIPGVRLLSVGDGPLREALQRKTVELGLNDCVEFLGSREDVPELFAGADLFVFPSISEGLGMAAIEAQFAGLPVLLASHLPEELEAIPSLCHRLAIDLPVEVWVKMIQQLRFQNRTDIREQREGLSASPYSIHHNIRRLGELYAK